MNSATQRHQETATEADVETQETVRITLPFKDQESADTARKQLKDICRKIGTDLQTVFTCRKIGDKHKMQENKPILVNYQCVVYHLKCDLCDGDYIGYTTKLHQHVEEHRASVIGKHVKYVLHLAITNLTNMFPILKKCQGKLDCLIQEMLFIHERKPKLNTQSDSISTKVLFNNI